MVYDEGFEIKIGSEIFFAFYKYKIQQFIVKNFKIRCPKMMMMNKRKDMKVFVMKL